MGHCQKMITYRAINTLNGKFYIGSTLDFEARKQQHLKSPLNYPFQNALKKSPESFDWEIFEDDSESPVLEQALLDMWFGTEMCYNLCPHANRPQCNPESASEWGKVNGPIQGRARHETKTGIFDPKYSDQRHEWHSRAGKKTASIFGKSVRVIAPNGTFTDYPSLKQAGRESEISLMTIKRLLKKGKGASRTGFRVEII